MKAQLAFRGVIIAIYRIQLTFWIQKIRNHFMHLKKPEENLNPLSDFGKHENSGDSVLGSALRAQEDTLTVRTCYQGHRALIFNGRLMHPPAYGHVQHKVSNRRLGGASKDRCNLVFNVT